MRIKAVTTIEFIKMLSTSLNSSFPGDLFHPVPHLFLYLIQKRTSGITETEFLMGRMSFLPTIRVKALKGTQSTNSNQCPGLILSSSTARRLTERPCCHYTSSLMPVLVPPPGQI